MKPLYFLALMMISLYLKNAVAQSCGEVSSGAQILYMNGNDTADLDSTIAMIRLSQLQLSNFLTPDEAANNQIVDFQFIKNPSEWAPRKAAEDAELELGIPKYKALMFYTTGFTFDFTTAQIDSLKEIFLNAFGVTTANISSTASAMKQAIVDSLTFDHKRAIVVAHSQGALFFNAAYENAFLQGQLGNERQINAGVFYLGPVAPASRPTSGIQNDLVFSDYITFTEDRVANFVRELFIPTVPSGNFVNPDSGITNHGILFDYLSSSMLPTVGSRLSNVGKRVRDASCVQILGCFAVNPLGEPGKLITNSDETTGGFVSDNSTFAATAYLGKDAQVCNGAKVLDNAQILGNTIISDVGTVVSGNALINGIGTRVDSGASVSDSAKILDNAGLGANAKVFGQATMKENSLAIGNVSISENAILKGNTFAISFGSPANSVEVKGSAVIAGSYILAINAKVSGTLQFSGQPAGIVGEGVVLQGSGTITNAGFSDNVQLNGNNLNIEGDGQNGNVLIFQNAQITDAVRITGSAFMGGNSTLKDNAILGEHAFLTGSSIVQGQAEVHDNSIIQEQAIISGFAQIFGNSNIGKNCALDSGAYAGLLLPDFNTPSNPLNLFCPGFYQPPAPLVGRDDPEAEKQAAIQRQNDFLLQAAEIKRQYLNGTLQSTTLYRSTFPKK